jgi:hypothetical protein
LLWFAKAAGKAKQANEQNLPSSPTAQQSPRLS